MWGCNRTILKPFRLGAEWTPARHQQSKQQTRSQVRSCPCAAFRSVSTTSRHIAQVQDSGINGLLDSTVVAGRCKRHIQWKRAENQKQVDQVAKWLFKIASCILAQLVYHPAIKKSHELDVTICLLSNAKNLRGLMRAPLCLVWPRCCKSWTLCAKPKRAWIRRAGRFWERKLPVPPGHGMRRWNWGG